MAHAIEERRTVRWGDGWHIEFRRETWTHYVVVLDGQEIVGGDTLPEVVERMGKLSDFTSRNADLSELMLAVQEGRTTIEEYERRIKALFPKRDDQVIAQK